MRGNGVFFVGDIIDEGGRCEERLEVRGISSWMEACRIPRSTREANAAIVQTDGHALRGHASVERERRR